MYRKQVHGHLLIGIFGGQIGIQDLQNLADDIQQLSKEKDEIFVIAFIAQGGSYPNSLPEILKIFQLNSEYMKRIKRLYRLRYNSVITFISDAVAQALNFHRIADDYGDLDSLFKAVEADTEKYPKLKASLENWDAIKAEIIDMHRNGIGF